MQLSLSILGYEKNLRESEPIARKILEHCDYLHIDIMRKPFIPDRDAFPPDAIKMVRDWHPKLDIHIMGGQPEKDITRFAPLIPLSQRKQSFVVIHAEAYRRKIGKYESKEFDLLVPPRQ